MNLTKHEVVELISTDPYVKDGMWCVDVVVDSWGNRRPTTLQFRTKDAADKVDKGYEYDD